MEVEREMQRIDAQLAEKKSAKDEATGNLADMNKLLLSMNEARAKFAKSCDADSLKQIKTILVQPGSASAGTGKQILDKICQFICQDVEATYDRHGADIFANAEVLTAAIKRCDPAALEKSWIRDVADSVNMTSEGVKGKILQAISSSSTVQEMHHFFPYFKVLYKFCQLGMTLKSKQNLLRKEEAAKKETDDLLAKKATQQEILDNLDFSNDIQKEVDRMREQEIGALVQKAQMLEMKINELRIHEDENMSYQLYFQGLA